ncbi:MAG: response regulator [Deltaproteobacteria bacterium]|nr:response regulator [Deltaproteobacteria bacterium]
MKPVKDTALPDIEKTKLSVLIAEDNAVSQRHLIDRLNSLGYDVVGCASNGEDAVKMVCEKKPQLVIMDVMMPKMDGIEAAKQITAHSPVPIILLTGKSSDELADRAIEAGVFAYLIKPVTKKDLIPAIKLALSRFDEFKKLEKEVYDLKEVLETRKLVEKAKGILMKRCNIHEDEAFKLLQSYSQNENKKIRDIADSIITASRFM